MDMDPIATKATIEHNGYYLIGRGPHKVMVLHGWLTDAASWSALWSGVNRESFTWCFMDARGYGLSRDRRGAYSMEEIAQDALALADSLGWSVFSLVGHSMAGLAIQRVLLAAPHRVRGLVGVAAVPASGGGLVGDRRSVFDQAVETPQARAAVIDFSTGTRRGETWVRNLTQQSFACSQIEAVRGYLDAWADLDFHDEIEGNTTPVGVVIGEHDPSLSPRRMEETWLSWYPHNHLNVLPDCAHYPMHEQPVALIGAIEQSLADHPACTPIPAQEH
jgi:esterase